MIESTHQVQPYGHTSSFQGKAFDTVRTCKASVENGEPNLRYRLMASGRERFLHFPPGDQPRILLPIGNKIEI